MKHNSIKFSFLALVFLTFTSCEKVIEIELNEADSQYVVVGNINKGEYASISLTKSIGFSAENKYPAVTAAVVTLTDSEGNKETLTETKPGIYEGKSLKGKSGVTYTLDIKHDGKTITSTSKMPDLTVLNDIKAAPSNLGGIAGEVYNIFPIYTNAPNVRNYYRYRQFINGKEDKSILVTDDIVNDGKINARPLFSREQIMKGDTVRIQLIDIDENMYNYFYSLGQSTGEGPGGGSTPANPVSNLSNRALGYFSAQAVSEKELIIK